MWSYPHVTRQPHISNSNTNVIGVEPLYVRSCLQVTWLTCIPVSPGLNPSWCVSPHIGQPLSNSNQGERLPVHVGRLIAQKTEEMEYINSPPYNASCSAYFLTNKMLKNDCIVIGGLIFSQLSCKKTNILVNYLHRRFILNKLSTYIRKELIFV